MGTVILETGKSFLELIVVMVIVVTAKLCDYTKTHQMVRINWTVCSM